jgi:hypothetical protein
MMFAHDRGQQRDRFASRNAPLGMIAKEERRVRRRYGGHGISDRCDRAATPRAGRDTGLDGPAPALRSRCRHSRIVASQQGIGIRPAVTHSFLPGSG